jgi:hypothetical protein
MKTKRKMGVKGGMPGKDGTKIGSDGLGRGCRSDHAGFEVGVLAAVVLLCIGAATASARKKPTPTKTVTGQVFDAANKGIDGADVELTDLTTKKKLDMYTQQNGTYEFGGLSFDHSYHVQAHYKGQISETRTVSSWDTRPELVLNLYLRPPKK